MATYTDAELLVKVREAIAGTLDRNAESITIGGRTLGSFSLKELWELEKALTQRIAVATAGSFRGKVLRFRSPV